MEPNRIATTPRGQVLVLWYWGGRRREVEINVGAPRVTVVNIVGAQRTIEAPDGRLTLTLTPDPVHVIGVNIH